MFGLIPRLHPHLGLAELRAAWALSLVDDASVVERFETAFARLANQRHAVAFPHGRTGLVCLLLALGLDKREIIVPAWTCVVVPHAVVFSGNEPVFVDCAPNHYNMDLGLAQREINERTGAVVATSLFGHPVDLEALDALREAHPGLPVIQDYAHAFFCTSQGRPVHKEGIAALFGLNISKLMTSIFGGMVTTDDDRLAQRLRAQRDRLVHAAHWTKAWHRRLYLCASAAALWPPAYRLVNRLERGGWLDAFVRYFDEGAIAMPADWTTAMTAPEARVGLMQCGKYRDIVETRRNNAKTYSQMLAGIASLRLPPWDDGATWSHYTALTPQREHLLEQALGQGVQLGRLIEYNIPDMTAYRQRSGHRDCPQARAFARQSINLPLWGDDETTRRTVRITRAFATGQCQMDFDA